MILLLYRGLKLERSMVMFLWRALHIHFFRHFCCKDISFSHKRQRMSAIGKADKADRKHDDRTKRWLTGIKSRLQFETVNMTTLVLATAIPNNRLHYTVRSTQYDRLSQQQLSFTLVFLNCFSHWYSLFSYTYKFTQITVFFIRIYVLDYTGSFLSVLIAVRYSFSYRIVSYLQRRRV